MKEIHKAKIKLQKLRKKHFVRVNSNIIFSCPVGGYTEIYGPFYKYKDCKSLQKVLNRSNDRRIKAEIKIAYTKCKYHKLVIKAYLDALTARRLAKLK